jgi:hypothetical protein
LISPDYIGAMREVVQNETGAPCLFLQGASGELAAPEQYTGDLEVPERHGRRLGYAILSSLAAMQPAGTELAFQGVVESGAPLAVWKSAPRKSASAGRTLEATILKVGYALKSMATADEMAVELENCTDRVLAERIRRRLRIRRSIGDGDISTESVWVWRLGEALLVAQRNEAYSLFQRELRAQHPERTLAVVNLANGSVGYLPPADRYGDDLYPVWQTPYDRGGLEALISACGQALDSIITPE